MQNPEKPSSDQVVVVLEQNPPPPGRHPTKSPDPQVPSYPTTPRTPAAAKQLPPRAALTRLPYSKPKSRFVELNHPLPPRPLRSSSPVPEHDYAAPLLSTSSDSEEEEEEEEEAAEDKAIREKYLTRRRRRITWRVLLEWSAFFVITAFLTASLAIPNLHRRTLWGLHLWRWAVAVLAAFCGRLVSGWLVSTLAFAIERHFLLREKVLYFVYGLRRSFQNCIWLGFVVLAWTLIFDRRMEVASGRRRHTLLFFVSRALIAVSIAANIWLVKILLVKILASSFHVATFFDRIKESVFHHYILEALSGPPLDHQPSDPDDPPPPPPRRRKLVVSKTMPSRLASRRIDMEKLRRLSRSRPSACSMRRLVGHVLSTGLSTISRTVDEFGRNNAESVITSEWDARVSADRVFKNVAKPGHKYIEEEDLLRFLTREEVHTIFPLFEGALETERIKKSAFRNWVVRAYLERKSLCHSLNDTKTAVQQLHKLASAVVCVIIIVVSLLVMGVATSQVFVVVTSQLLLVGFMFQNTCKTIFESIIFVFVMHPFDVGDRCVIDGVHMIVEEMNILSTVFLRFDNEKIFYPNSVLLTKPISNFYRSPDMSDMIDFSIDVSTSFEHIAAMKKCIQSYIESKPKHWNPKHTVVVKEIENVNKMKMALVVLHTMNHQNFAEKINRRSELLLELKKIFESLGIRYHLLPQEVHLSQTIMANGRIPPVPVKME